MIIEKRAPNSLELIAATLEKGELVIMPCDTIYGIVGLVDVSLEALVALKGRAEGKKFLQLTTLEMAQSIAVEPIDEQILKLWPAALTVIIKNRQGGTTAVRVPADPYLIKLLERLQKPLYSTSVNLADSEPLNTFPTIVKLFKSKVGLCVKGDKKPTSLPSTILDITQKSYKIVREGAVDVSFLINKQKKS
ncbi:MAG: Sua5/YciO/YrdC/YwlC family protein [Sphaerochaetaceae bacterium]